MFAPVDVRVDWLVVFDYFCRSSSFYVVLLQWTAGTIPRGRVFLPAPAHEPQCSLWWVLLPFLVFFLHLDKQAPPTPTPQECSYFLNGFLQMVRKTLLCLQP